MNLTHRTDSQHLSTIWSTPGGGSSVCGGTAIGISNLRGKYLRP